jgi:hypothetical protein
VVAVSFSSNHVVKEDKLCSVRYYFMGLFCQYSSRNYLWYLVGMTPHSKNDTTGSILINNMTPPHIWLS